MNFTSLLAFCLASPLLRLAAQPSPRTQRFEGSTVCDHASLVDDIDDAGLSLLQMSARSLPKPAELSKMSAQAVASKLDGASLNVQIPFRVVSRGDMQAESLRPVGGPGELRELDEQIEFDPMVNRSIWNGTWVNFTIWHPVGAVSNVHRGQVVWADVNFMNLGHLCQLSLLAYPILLLAAAMFGSVFVGYSLEPKHALTSDTPSGPPVVSPSQLTLASRQVYALWEQFCRCLPSLLVFGVPLTLVYLSHSLPEEIFTITLVISSAVVFANGLHIVLFSPFVLAKLARNMEKSATEVCAEICDDQHEALMHWLILPNYKEDVDNLTAAIASVAKSTLAKTQIGVVLAMEAREGAHGQMKAQQLTQEFAGTFKELVSTFHPSDLPNDPPGKASNVAFAFKWLAGHVGKNGNDPSNVIVTIADADSEFHETYFELLTKTFFDNSPETRNSILWQSPVLHMKNYHRQPGPVIVGSLYTAMSELSALGDPNAVRLPYSTYSLTMSLATEVGGWDAEWIAEDWHMGIKCFLLTLGRTTVQPVLLPTLNYSPEADGWTSTIQARITQAMRHSLGFSDLAYYFMMLPLILVDLNAGKRPGISLADFWRLFFSSIPYMVKLVNTHAILGMMVLYSLLGVVLKNVMLYFLNQSIAGLFSRTVFATSMLGITSACLTMGVAVIFQVLYGMLRHRLERPAENCEWLFEFRFLHWLMTVFSLLLCGPAYFLTLAGGVWNAALRLPASRTFRYDVAAKPTKVARLA